MDHRLRYALAAFAAIAALIAVSAGFALVLPAPAGLGTYLWQGATAFLAAVFAAAMVLRRAREERYWARAIVRSVAMLALVALLVWQGIATAPEAFWLGTVLTALTNYPFFRAGRAS